VVEGSWDDIDVWTQALIIAYGQIREYDEVEEIKAMSGVGSHHGSKPAKIRGRRRR
jgi:hypothetical protein